MPSEDDWADITLDQLRAWDWAPENPALLRQQGLEIALSADGISDKKMFRKNLSGAIDRGLSEADALAALTTVPAKICGVEKFLGTIESGKLANLTIVDGNYFQPESKVREVWVDGRNYRVQFSHADPAKEKESEEKKPLPRVAHSPLDGRGPIESPETFVVRGATLWTSGPKGILTNADFIVEKGKKFKARQ